MISVDLLIPSANDSLHPYKLSNLDFVAASFTLKAGKRRDAFSTICCNLATPVVVSSETPIISGTILCQ